MRIIKIFIVLAALQNVFFGQTETGLFPDKLNIQPFTANILEPRVGVSFQLNNNELRLDIGNSLDIVRFNIDQNTHLSIGADFFTFTLLRGEHDFHFPVDAVDYLFGINAGFKKKIDETEIGARFRLSHISSHFVDGHFDFKNEIWRNGLNPRVYSREFLEFIPFYKIDNFRVYGGAAYIFHVDPKYIGKMNYQAGFDWFFENVLFEYAHPFIAYDLKLIDINGFTANNTINAGLKIGHSAGKGISIYYTFYSGKSVHGEYFDFNKNYSAIGFNLDL